jgi:pyruvate dehydrogenase E2 component (dihydrolipoamide acetyltransferase)
LRRAEEQWRAQQLLAEALRRRATPAARRRAEELGVDLSKVKGSGALGGITLEDVNKHLRM